MRPGTYTAYRRRAAISDDLLDELAEDVARLTSRATPTGRPASDQPPPKAEPAEPPPVDLVRPPTPVTVNYAFADLDLDGLPVTWRIDRPIKVVLLPADMGYPHFVRDAAHAIKKVAAAADFPLRLASHEGRDADDADITVGWVPNLAALNTSQQRAVATAHTTTQQIDGRRCIVHADIRLRSDVRLKAGFVRDGWGPVLLHELLHSLGARHCTDPKQIMHPSSNTATDLGLGDRLCIRLLAEAGHQRERR